MDKHTANLATVIDTMGKQLFYNSFCKFHQ